jgi:hypothetical protein
MGRKSKLTPEQWAEVDRRLINGEPARAIARHYDVSETVIRNRKSAQVQDIKDVAQQIVATERALTKLPISAQITAQNLAAKLRAISDSLASAAQLGAATAHRLHALANAEVNKVDDADPLGSLESLKSVGVLTKLGNDSSHIALNLLAANKETVAKANDEEDAAALTPIRPQISRDEWMRLHSEHVNGAQQ